ncbi:MAG: uracil-DNA glycosylase [Spirochaetota bacterium]
MNSLSEWERLNERIINCNKCERLLHYCRAIAEKKRRAYKNWNYWGKPVPNFGDPCAELLVVGLAPAAHGANRTGRLFTGDRSGDFLYRALWKAGFSNTFHSTHCEDGLILHNCAITATLHCAPPANRPGAEEIHNCYPWFEETVAILPVRVFLALGGIGWRTVINYARNRGLYEKAMPEFQHGAFVEFNNESLLLGSYHPSQQNVFTRRLTEEMFDEILMQVKSFL